MAGKLIGLSEVGRFVRNGMSLGVGGGPLLSAPTALVREVIRSGTRDLRLIACSTGGYAVDLLIGAGCAASAEFAQISLYEYGFAPNFRRFAESGRLRCLDHT
jgi:glutaconate CoA-transferase subunit A